MKDPYNLERFVEAQNPVFEQACAELRRGGKEGHWMWFMFPQMKGLGYSPMSMKFAISSKEEAEAYLKHPILGPRLRECTQLVVLVERTFDPRYFWLSRLLEVPFLCDSICPGNIGKSSVHGRSEEIFRW